MMRQKLSCGPFDIILFLRNVTSSNFSHPPDGIFSHLKILRWL